MKTLLTVDWDFFVKEDQSWDMGHRENLMFLKMLWSTRGNLIDLMRTTGDEVGFWPKAKDGGSFNAPLWVSDSHMYAYGLLRGVSRVVIVDAHHDCWPGNPEKPGMVSCDNWLRAWLKGSKKRRATWVKPGWQSGDLEIPKDMRSQVEAVEWQDGLKLGLEGPVVAHVCRSGCWTPPWLDRAFLGFLEAFGGGMEGVCRMQDGEWDPLKERWTEKELGEAREQAAKIREMMAKYNAGKAA